MRQGVLSPATLPCAVLNCSAHGYIICSSSSDRMLNVKYELIKLLWCCILQLFSIGRGRKIFAKILFWFLLFLTPRCCDSLSGDVFLLFFCYCNKIPETTNLKRKSRVLWLTFWRFQSIVIPVPLNQWWRAAHHGGENCTFHFGQEAEREGGRSWGPTITSTSLCQCPSFLPLGSASTTSQ